jgi:hypothetical protein
MSFMLRTRSNARSRLKYFPGFRLSEWDGKSSRRKLRRHTFIMANEIVTEYLDQFGTTLKADIAKHARGDKNNKGFTNDSMIWYIMAWTKIAIVTNGNGYRRSASAFLDKRDLPAVSATWSRSKEADRALGTYAQYVENGNSVNGDFFQRADKAAMDFFYDYRQHTVGMDEGGKTGEKDFIQKLKQFTVLSPDEVRKKEIFNMDRSA